MYPLDGPCVVDKISYPNSDPCPPAGRWCGVHLAEKGRRRRITAGRLVLAAVALLTTLAAAAPPALAQGTGEDYARAQRFLLGNARELVFRDRVSPNWIEGTDRFWYRNDLPDGSDYVLVDPGAGTREVVAGPQGPVAGPTGAPRGRADAPAPEPGQSPDGRWLAFVRDYDLYARCADTGWEVRLTHDGERDYAYATPLPNPLIMVRQGTEHVEQRPAVFWSPDSKRLLTYAMDSRGAGRLTMVEHAPSDRVRPRSYTYAYPLPQDSIIPTSHPVIFEAGTWSRIDVPMEPIPQLYYGGPSFSWFEDGQRAYTVQTDRGFTRRQVREIEGATGRVRIMVDEVGEPYASGTLLRFLDDGAEVLWGSERDGWMHLYLYDGRTGRVKNQVTRGEWRVRQIVHVDQAARVVYFTAGGKEEGRDPYLRHLYRVNLDGSGLRLLTPEDADHAVTFLPSGRWFVDTYSRGDLPPVSVLRQASDGRVVVQLEEADISRLTALGWQPPEPFRTIARDGETEIFGIIWRPSNFDPNRRYPVIEQVYTGPHGAHVPKTFDAYGSWPPGQAVAELGFIVVMTDGMGTSLRSRAFHQVSRENLGDGGLPDRIRALQELARRYPCMDLDRVGIYGGSAGGYDAVRSMLMQPDFYKVGVAWSGNHDARLDKASWITQWMGFPIGDHYHEQSNVTQAHRLEGRLLMGHGSLDENVPVSASLQVADALIAADKDFDLVIIPNIDHGIGRHPYFIRRFFDHFVRHLHGVEPPRAGPIRLADPVR